MKPLPHIFDHAALKTHRRRAVIADLFLQRAALEEVQDRLSMVNRAFTSAAIVSPFPALWQPGFPDARCVGDTETLDLEPGAYDLVIHAMALHWSNDPVGQLIQCRHALREDGFFLSIAPGGQTLAELRAALGQAESEITGGLSPRISPMGEIRELGALLQRAGFALPVADSIDLTATYRDLTHLMHDLRAMGETNALAHRLRRPTRRAVFQRAAELYQAHFGLPDGRIPARFELVCLTGWSPSESQPKPLRPGSAKMRLADALNTSEKPLRD